MKLFYKSKKRNFAAEALYENDRITVLKGSKISEKIDNFRISKVALSVRNDINIVNSQYKLLKDVDFKSLSAAAQFVSGASTNGLKVWKDKNGNSVNNIIEKD